ncbi:hypothetical protein GWI33_006622 [Rhynchophorus ferrugineus]|uniref:Uncharacterized protein n=1 Tax=Rhynchophorus ferrugineus TaxID=354439 RepID=A0A834IK50_RHYFE|nr:hypothetical protein GWI33_006622 [Rhynchophorus ferrugineus]
MGSLEYVYRRIACPTISDSRCCHHVGDDAPSPARALGSLENPTVGTASASTGDDPDQISDLPSRPDHGARRPEAIKSQTTTACPSHLSSFLAIRGGQFGAV